jgi:hypothetical protein
VQSDEEAGGWFCAPTQLLNRCARVNALLKFPLEDNIDAALSLKTLDIFHPKVLGAARIHESPLTRATSILLRT